MTTIKKNPQVDAALRFILFGASLADNPIPKGGWIVEELRKVGFDGHKGVL